MTTTGRATTVAESISPVRTPDPRTQRELRDRVRRLLADVEPEPVDAAVLVVDELVSNAYLHASRPWQVRLQRIADGACLRVEVDDPAAPMSTELGDPRRAADR